MADGPFVRLRLPPAFIRDCIECCCDVGEYERGWLRAAPEQLDELRNRAEYYADTNGPDGAPYVRIAAKALLRALDRETARTLLGDTAIRHAGTIYAHAGPCRRFCLGKS